MTNSLFQCLPLRRGDTRIVGADTGPRPPAGGDGMCPRAVPCGRDSSGGAAQGAGTPTPVGDQAREGRRCPMSELGTV